MAAIIEIEKLTLFNVVIIAQASQHTSVLAFAMLWTQLINKKESLSKQCFFQNQKK